jgi:hypothetical protein
MRSDTSSSLSNGEGLNCTSPNHHCMYADADEEGSSRGFGRCLRTAPEVTVFLCGVAMNRGGVAAMLPDAKAAGDS